jgi:hypothetical protein
MTTKAGVQFRNNAASANGSSGASTTGSIKVWSGSAPSDPDATATGTLLATFALTSSGGWSSPSSGETHLVTVPLTGTINASGTAGYYRLLDSGGNTLLQGSVTATGGGGDLTVGSTTITSGDTAQITSYGFTVPQ